jgi:hypothetical protein
MTDEPKRYRIETLADIMALPAGSPTALPDRFGGVPRA